jgi:hypothetical protein
VVGEQAPVFGYALAVVVVLVWWGPFVYGMYLSQVVMRRGDPRLLKRGIRGQALVLDAKQTNTIIQEGEFEWQAPFVYRYHLRVTLPGKEPYETYSSICLSGIEPGETVEVAASPLNRKRVTIDPGADRVTVGTEPSWAPDMTTRKFAPDGSLAHPAPSTGGTSTGPDRLGELERLADLHDRGALTDAEFAAEKARVLAEGGVSEF